MARRAHGNCRLRACSAPTGPASFPPRRHQGLLSPPALTVKHECLHQAEPPVLPTFPLRMERRRSSVSLSILLPALRFGRGWHVLPPLLLLWPGSRYSISIPTYPPSPSPSVHSPVLGLAVPISPWILLSWPGIHGCDTLIPGQLQHSVQLFLKFTQDQAQAHECCI